MKILIKPIAVILLGAYSFALGQDVYPYFIDSKKQFEFEEEEVIKSIVKISLPSALIKMQNGIDLRIKDLKTKFTDHDVLSELYLDILE